MKKKMNLATEIDLTQDSVVQLTCWCGQIALHELWGLGRVRLDRITRRQEQLGNESLAVVMVPDRNGMPQTEKARQLRAEALQTEEIVVENIDDEKTVQTLSRSYQAQEDEFLKRAVMMAAGRRAGKQGGAALPLSGDEVRRKIEAAKAQMDTGAYRRRS